MSDKLVMVDDGQPKTTTLQIAQGLGVKHENVIKLVRSYMPDFMAFGNVNFKETNEVANSGFKIRNSNAGRYTVYAELNEQQATFLMTLMRNSPKVIAFKKALVQAFFYARSLLQSETMELMQQYTLLSDLKEREQAFASLCGKGLSDWKKRRDDLNTAILSVQQQMQPQLPFNRP
ncbi:Rha family transcriptional regulator [Moraxella bovis]|uniref:Rha family transcriptional regulator n=1 Tax=Moraxella bovis TaxID=476 RepID=UPI002226C4DD|nr:Rha family transcriptional regulator [Moraxella bovis]UYZ74911.1 Rha family transcriptional regulator [Moraxella bovis]